MRLRHKLKETGSRRRSAIADHDVNENNMQSTTFVLSWANALKQ